jgi:hypothetical protein
MAMEQLPVAGDIAPARSGGGDVVDFEQVSIADVQSTPGAAPSLPVEQVGDSGWQERVASQLRQSPG